MTLQHSGRIIGVLLLIQFALGVTTLQVLTAPLSGEGGYLLNGAGIGRQLGVSVLLSLFGGVLAIAIAAVAYPVFKRYGERLALAVVLMALWTVGISAVEQAGVLSMRAFSDAYALASIAQREVFDTLAVAGASLRNGTHYVGLLVAGAELALWYFCLLRFSLLPSPIAVFGLLAVALQLYSISLPILGGEVSFLLLAPLGLAQLAQSGWLIVFGFRRPDP